MQKERTLFDDHEQPKIPRSDVPFDAAILALDFIRGLGHKGLRILVGHLKENLGAVFKLNYEDLKTLFSDLRISNSSKVAAAIVDTPEQLLQSGNVCLDDCRTKDIKVISPSLLPQCFQNLENEAPKWLFVQGDEKLLEQSPKVAVVGTRKPTANGYRATNIISHVLSPYPIAVVSGLADGIDAEAHWSTLQRGLKNIAFLGHGINTIFPVQTSEIRSEIIRQGGAIVSEYMPNQSYQKNQFIERNRLQAAIADIVIPVEAATASGTAHTVRFARKYRRQIIGVKWEGVNGIVDDLISKDDKIIQIFTSKGARTLDSCIRNLMEEYGQSSYPFHYLEQQIAREMNGRMFCSEDLTKLTDKITKLGQDALENG